MLKKPGKVARKRTAKAKGRKRAATRSTKKRAKPRKLVVRRTSGRKEKFDKDKMAQTLSRSGTPFLIARDVAKTVSGKISRNKEALGEGPEVEIDGSVIREMVVEEPEPAGHCIVAQRREPREHQAEPARGGQPERACP